MLRRHARPALLLTLAFLTLTSAGCSGSSSANGAANPSAPTATTGTPAETVSSLLAAYGSGQITTKHMPTADPSWVARVNSMADGSPNIDGPIPGMRNLVALVDEAAREGDTKSLLRLCFECQTDAALESRVSSALGASGALAQLGKLLEAAHAISQDGLTYPSFALTPDQPDAIMTADVNVLGATSASAYLKTGMVTAFPRYAGQNVDQSAHWAGVSVGTAA